MIGGNIYYNNSQLDRKLTEILHLVTGYTQRVSNIESTLSKTTTWFLNGGFVPVVNGTYSLGDTAVGEIVYKVDDGDAVTLNGDFTEVTFSMRSITFNGADPITLSEGQIITFTTPTSLTIAGTSVTSLTAL